MKRNDCAKRGVLLKINKLIGTSDYRTKASVVQEVSTREYSKCVLTGS